MHLILSKTAGREAERETMKTESQINPDLCVCCGKPIPEGRMVCYACETDGNSRTVKPPKDRKYDF